MAKEKVEASLDEFLVEVVKMFGDGNRVAGPMGMEFVMIPGVMASWAAGQARKFLQGEEEIPPPDF
jgi:hypothetical protein